MHGAPTEASSHASPQTLRGAAWRRFRRNRYGVAGAILAGFVILIAVLAPVLSTHSPTKQYPSGVSEIGAPLAPNATFLLGTDNLGRDVYSRILYGSRVSLFISLAANLLSLTVAMTLGTIAGYAGGLTDTLIMRLTDILMSFPVLLLAGFLAVVMRPGVWVVILVMGLTSWFYLARVVRGEVLSVRQREHVQAARALGGSEFRIVSKHVLPEIMGQVLVFGTLNFSTTIVFVAALSYIGIGVQPPTPDWGNMIAEGASYLTTAPWLVLAPGCFLAVSVLGFNLLGDGLRDALDPKEMKGKAR